MTKDGTLKEWDIKADGIIDLREYGTPDGGTAWEYASRLDGVFDVRRISNGLTEGGEEP